jgi:hypothetical protein
VNNDAPQYSENFLTGQVIVQEYKAGKVIKTRTKNEKFPVYLLRNFDPEVLRGNAHD